jgi:hypothetical protein
MGDPGSYEHDGAGALDQALRGEDPQVERLPQPPAGVGGRDQPEQVGDRPGPDDGGPKAPHCRVLRLVAGGLTIERQGGDERTRDRGGA